MYSFYPDANRTPDDVFNTNNGYLWVCTPREVEEVPAGYASSWGLFLPAAAVPLTGWTPGITYGEGP